MGLIKSVNDITYELQDQKTEKGKAKLEKIRKERIKNLLYDFFEIQFQALPNKKTTYKKLLEQKDFAISQIKNAYFEEYETKLNDDNISYINQNYFKILNSVKRQYFEFERIKQKEAERKQKQIEQKRNENIKRAKQELENYTKNILREELEENGSGHATVLYNKIIKNNILTNYFDQLKQHDEKFYKIQFKSELEKHFDVIYYKILKEEQKAQEQHEKSTQKEQESEQNKTEINAGAWIGGIITTILIIIFLPLLFCLFVIGAALKSI